VLFSLTDRTSTRIFNNILSTSVQLIRVILVGGRDSGKSRIADTLRNPCLPIYDYQGTSSTLRYDMRMNDLNHLRIYDTPGLKNNVGEDEIQNFVYPILQDCDNQLNVICFVSHPRKLDDYIKALNVAITNVFSSACSSISMLILTHADRFNTDRMNRMKDEIQQNSAFRNLLEFCKLGIYYSGVVNYHELEDSDNENEFKRRLKLIEPARNLLMQTFRQCAKYYVSTQAPSTKFMVPQSDTTRHENHHIPNKQCIKNQDQHQAASKGMLKAILFMISLNYERMEKSRKSKCRKKNPEKKNLERKNLEKSDLERKE
jgi:hypothetical protein